MKPRGVTATTRRVRVVGLLLLMVSVAIVLAAYHDTAFMVSESVDHFGEPLPSSVPVENRQPTTAAATDLVVSSTRNPKFAVVLLSYRSPESLRTTLRSLCDAEVHRHESFAEFVVYFQVFDEQHDTELVARVLGPSGPCEGATFRVMGKAANLPVASATFAALRAVTAELILYLECDRPVMEFPAMSLAQRRLFVRQQLDAAVLAVTVGSNDDGRVVKADVFRLQLYSSIAIQRLNSSLDQRLPASTYGASPYTHCRNVLRYHHATATTVAALSGDTGGVAADDASVDPTSLEPLPEPAICGNKGVVKRRLGNVFYTAYCKHWSKLQKTAGPNRDVPQQDMCDSFCFFQWATSLLHGNNASTESPAERTLAAQDDVMAIRQMMESAVSLHRLPNRPSSGYWEPEMRQRASTTTVLCMDSTWCNWSNQPSMYRRQWYLDHIAQPCEDTKEGRLYCIGSPGRQSAVRQELFFVKHRAYWAKKRHRICLSSGLFIHHEVDNRE